MARTISEVSTSDSTSNIIGLHLSNHVECGWIAEILAEPVSHLRIISHVGKRGITGATRHGSYIAGGVIVLDRQHFRGAGSPTAQPADATLGLIEGLVLTGLKSVRLEDIQLVSGILTGRLDGTMALPTPGTGIWKLPGPRAAVLTGLLTLHDTHRHIEQSRTYTLLASSRPPCLPAAYSSRDGRAGSR